MLREVSELGGIGIDQVWPSRKPLDKVQRRLFLSTVIALLILSHFSLPVAASESNVITMDPELAILVDNLPEDLKGGFPLSSINETVPKNISMESEVLKNDSGHDSQLSMEDSEKLIEDNSSAPDQKNKSIAKSNGSAKIQKVKRGPTWVDELNPDGTRTLTIHTGPINYYNGSEYVPIDSNIAIAGDEYEVTKGPYKAHWNKKGEVRAEKDGFYIAYSEKNFNHGGQKKEPTHPIGKPKVKGNKIAYEEFYPNTDLEYAYYPHLLKQNFIIHSLKPGRPKDEFLEFAGELDYSPELEMRIDGDTASGTSIEFVHQGETVFSIAPPIIKDSNESVITGEYELIEKGKKTLLVLKVPLEWMRDPSRVYPVSVDPTIYTYTSADSFVDEAWPYNDDNYGYEDRLRVRSWKGGDIRTWLKFYTGYTDIIQKDWIDSVKLKMYAYDWKTGRTIRAHLSTDDSWKEWKITWDNQPSYFKYSQYASKSSGSYWRTWDVESIVKYHWDRDSYITFVLKDSSEGSWSAKNQYYYSWENYYKDPRLVIKYTEPPLDDEPPTVSVSGAPGAWQNYDAYASVSCSDYYTGGSGCDSGTYRLKIYSSYKSSCPTSYSSYYSYSLPKTISSQKWICAAAKDNEGNIGFSSYPVKFKVDKIKPTSSITSPSSESWQRKSFTPSVTDEDSGGSGLKKCYYAVYDTGYGWTIDKWSERTCGSMPTISVGTNKNCRTQGKNKCRVYTYNKDYAGNSESSHYIAYSIDYTTPTYKSYSVSGCNYKDTANKVCWVKPGTTTYHTVRHYDAHSTPNVQYLTFTKDGCTPNTCTWGKEVKSYVYVDSGNFYDWMTNDNYLNIKDADCVESGGCTGTYAKEKWTVYSGTSGGNFKVWTFLYDEVWNGKGYTYVGWWYKVDKNKPTIKINSPAAGSWQSSDFSVDMTDKDDESGLKKCEYKVVSSGTTTKDWTSRTCSSKVTITVGSGKDCSHEGKNKCTVYARAKDKAGNWGSTTSRSFSIDWTKPTVSVTHSPTEPTDIQTVTFTASASDNIGITGIKIYVDGSLKKTCTSSPCSYTGGSYSVGSHTYYATAKDAANNAGRDPTKGTKSFTVIEACISHDSYSCYDNDIYWYDSCGNQEEKKEECGETTEELGSNYCSADKTKVLRDKTVHNRVCSVDYCDSYDSTETETVEVCAENEYCDEAECRPRWAPTWWSDLEEVNRTEDIVAYMQNFSWDEEYLNYFKSGDVDYQWELRRPDTPNAWDFIRYDPSTGECTTEYWWTDLPGYPDDIEALEVSEERHYIYDGDGKEVWSCAWQANPLRNEELELKVLKQDKLQPNFNYSVYVELARRTPGIPIEIASESEYCGDDWPGCEFMPKYIPSPLPPYYILNPLYTPPVPPWEKAIYEAGVEIGKIKFDYYEMESKDVTS